MTSPEGAAWAAAGSVAARLASAALQQWYDEKKSRDAIIRLFQDRFVNAADKRVIPGAHRGEVADLIFEVEAEVVKTWRVGKGRQVTVTNTTLPGANPKYQRVFRYWDQPFITNQRRVNVSWVTSLVFTIHPQKKR
mgnify:CR=1 FL=1